MLRRVSGAFVAVALLAPAPAVALDDAQLTKILTRQAKLAGPSSGVYVEDVDSGVPVFAARATTPRLVASVQKLWTSAAVLSRFRDGARLTTAVLKDQPIDLYGLVHGDLYLRGAGDPRLTSRDIDRLARQVKGAGIVGVRRVVGDGTAFDRKRGLAEFGFEATPDVPPLSGLMVDRGQIREGIIGYQPAPALFAAQKLTRALRERGVEVGRRAVAGRTPLLALAVGAVQSPTIRQLLKQQNVYSDNYIAESLLKVVAHADGARGSTAHGAAVARRAAARRFGARPAIVDGSGISRGNTSSPQDVVALLSRSFSDRAFVRSLPVVGQTGTVAFRLRGAATYNRCRAKTGTLSDVSTLAGYCGTIGGQTLAFAIFNNFGSTFSAHTVQDRMVAAIARYDP